MSLFMMLQVEGDPSRPAEVVTSEPRITFWHPVDTLDKV